MKKNLKLFFLSFMSIISTISTNFFSPSINTSNNTIEGIKKRNKRQTPPSLQDITRNINLGTISDNQETTIRTAFLQHESIRLWRDKFEFIVYDIDYFSARIRLLSPLIGHDFALGALTSNALPIGTTLNVQFSPQRFTLSSVIRYLVLTYNYSNANAPINIGCVLTTHPTDIYYRMIWLGYDSLADTDERMWDLIRPHLINMYNAAEIFQYFICDFNINYINSTSAELVHQNDTTIRYVVTFGVMLNRIIDLVTETNLGIIEDGSDLQFMERIWEQIFNRNPTLWENMYVIQESRFELFTINFNLGYAVFSYDEFDPNPEIDRDNWETIERYLVFDFTVVNSPRARSRTRTRPFDYNVVYNNDCLPRTRSI